MKAKIEVKGVYALSYALWRFEMWAAGFGTYEQIEWAVRRRILTPFVGAKDMRFTRLRKWLIKKFYRSPYE